MKNKSFYLHIGSPKTGTSALQYFLLKNRSVLNRKGFDYPSHTLDPNGVSSGNAKEFARCIQDNNAISESMTKKMLHTEYSSVILSSEYFFQIENQYISKIKDLLGRASTKIIVYFRRQDSMMIAAFNQGVKRHGFKEDISQYFETYKDKPYFYQSVIEQWGKVFGKENIIVRPYEKQQFFNGSIFSDFIHQLNLDLTTEFTLPIQNINSSYRIDALEIKRLFNRLPSLVRHLFKVDIILQQYSESRGKVGDWPYSLLSPIQRESICETHKWINTTIARNYLGRHDGRLFYDPLPDSNQLWEPYPGLSSNKVVEISRFLKEKDAALFAMLGKAVTEGLSSPRRDIQQAAQILAPGFKDIMASI